MIIPQLNGAFNKLNKEFLVFFMWPEDTVFSLAFRSELTAQKISKVEEAKMSYKVDDIGSIIANRRREMGLTQEGLAEILGVTPQAISKWERGSGYPDISLLPDLALTLGFSIDELFGKKTKGEKEKTRNTKGRGVFPPVYEGLRKVHEHRELACYSDLEVEKATGVMVHFAGGSSANLGTGEIHFRSEGDIKLVYADEIAEFVEDGAFDFPQFAEDEDCSEADFEPEISKEIEAEISSLVDSIIASNLPKTDGGRSASKEVDEGTQKENPLGDLAEIDSLRIESNGSLDFVIRPSRCGLLRWGSSRLDEIFENLTVKREGRTLVFVYDRKGNRGIFSLFGYRGNSPKNLRIEMPVEIIKSLDYQVYGSGDLMVELPLEQAKITIYGAGDVDLGNCKDLSLEISGAGDFSCGELGQAVLKTSGAGDIDIQRVYESLDVKLSGAGDVDVAAGDIDHLALNISGAGDFSAKNLTTNTADITLSGVGDAVIGRIKGESRERVSRLSDLQVLKRG